MDHIPLDSVDPSESRGPEVQTDPLSSPDAPRNQSTSHSQELRLDPNEQLRKLIAFIMSQPLISNFKALTWRFIQLFCGPGYFASLILDFWSLLLSIIWTDKQPGPDLLYPLSNLKKHKSGRLARLLLEHSRDLQQSNLHVAASPRDGIDPPRVAVIDLDEVPSEIIERGYAVSADLYGFVAMVMFLEIAITLLLHIFSPVDIGPYYRWLGEWISSWFGDWLGAWLISLADVLSTGIVQWMSGSFVLTILCIYAVIRGEGTLTLVRRSDISSPSCAILLDRDFTVVLTGAHNVVEAIAESSFSISHPFSRRYQLEGWQFGQYLQYELLKAWCEGIPLAILAGFWLLLNPASLLMAFVPLIPTVIVSFVRARTDFSRAIHMARQQDLNEYSKMAVIAITRSLISVMPTILLILAYEVAIAKHSIVRSIANPTFLLHDVPPVLIMIHFMSSRHYHIRTAKLLDILGPPPLRRWEFDTLAAAATFQCLVLCRGIPRPVRSFDVLTLMDIFVPDQTDVWKVWKARVADRIAHEVDISFAPTIPSFGDDRQKLLKELLDQAQIGYGAYTDFYDWHVPMYSTIAL